MSQPQPPRGLQPPRGGSDVTCHLGVEPTKTQRWEGGGESRTRWTPAPQPAPEAERPMSGDRLCRHEAEASAASVTPASGRVLDTWTEVAGSHNGTRPGQRSQASLLRAQGQSSLLAGCTGPLQREATDQQGAESPSPCPVWVPTSQPPRAVSVGTKWDGRERPSPKRPESIQGAGGGVTPQLKEHTPPLPGTLPACFSTGANRKLGKEAQSKGYTRRREPRACVMPGTLQSAVTQQTSPQRLHDRGGAGTASAPPGPPRLSRQHLPRQRWGPHIPANGGRCLV